MEKCSMEESAIPKREIIQSDGTEKRDGTILNILLNIGIEKDKRYFLNGIIHFPPGLADKTDLECMNMPKKTGELSSEKINKILDEHQSLTTSGHNGCGCGDRD